MKAYSNKQRNFNRFTICGILMLFNFSCENTIELEIPEKPSKLVVGGLFNTDSTMVIRVSRTEHILSYTDLERTPFEVNNATIELYQNGEFLEVLKPQTYLDLGDTIRKQNVYTTNGFVASEGNLYAINVSAPDFEPVEASTNVPSKILLTDFEVDPVMISLPDERAGLPAQISFQDPPGEENFYALEIMVEMRGHDDIHYTFSPEIVSLLEQKIGFTESNSALSREIYLSDASFDGQLYTYQFAILWYQVSDQTTSFKAILKHINKAHFEYATTARLQEAETRENPFSLPVQVRTNVKNGLGIFSGYNASFNTIKMTN